jgi:hypothetical protein
MDYLEKDFNKTSFSEQRIILIKQEMNILCQRYNQNDKIKCLCGSTFTKKYRSQHEQSNNHKKMYLKK